MSQKEFKVLSPTAILGYGFPEESFARGIEYKPDLIAVDAGSVDPGAYYLGAGKSFTNRTGVKRDLALMLKAGIEKNIPVMIGTAGGSGAKSHVHWCRDIILEIAKEYGLHFKMGIIYADIDKSLIIESMHQGKVTPLSSVPPLTEAIVNESVNIVAQMGVEPFQKAFQLGCQVVLAGRAYDPSCFAALPMMKGFDPALCLHMGKILECAAIAAEPGSGADSVLGILQEDGFVLRALSSERKFTSHSTAAHSLYEKSDPYYLPGPGGVLDLREVVFEEIGHGEVKVKGTKFIPSPQYQIKLEGVRKVGYRTISVAGTRDPIMIEKIEETIVAVQKRVEMLLKHENITGEVFFHIYGKNGVMGKLEPCKEVKSHELGIVMEVVAPTQDAADTICSLTRSTLLHYGYAGRISTAGNLAFPFSPSDTPCGPVYTFSLYHLMDLPSQDIFPIEIMTI